jgi:hypothetical protein
MSYGLTMKLLAEVLPIVKDIILTCVRWYVAYPLSYR